MSAPSESADLVVIGGGAAGYSAAVEALALGASVVLAEKGTEPGGSSVLSGGSFAFAGTDMQAEAGIEDSEAILRQDLLDDGGDTVDPALVDLYVREQMDCYRWLRELGVGFDQVSHSGGQSRPRSHGVKIRAAFQLIKARAESYPTFTSLLEEPAVSLVLDGGAVRGVVTRDGAGKQTTWTTGAVLLATGGFSRGARPIATFAPELLGARLMGGKWNTGDGLYLAMSAGADLCDVGEIKPTYGVSAELPGYPSEPTLLNGLYRGGIVVNKEGRRFVDESISYKLIGSICLKETDRVGYQIFDQKTMAQSIPDKLVNNYSGGLANGYVRKADTIAEIAEIAGIDVDVLVATVARYNEFAEAGVDSDFGRTSLSSGYGELAKIDSPPYYVYPSTAGVTSTYGGVRVDDHMRVRHVNGSVIDGLWAAGELVGGFHAHGYMSGSSLAKAVIFGRVAAADAVAAVNAARPTLSSER
ncbi:FAD-dependent oxidoreductase [Actinacidiphila sp. ITFR-21]|uniref:FAD-dependent oxidoreductase n=1 Tax=Actinacidiphila sp. ITFR-21 TaxID=3075199 RepID=UPI0028898681|nr:FAD-dependent oxidoreductase [Streptomyces sp. ITFR-21]WNI18743.1 FAD-binding protein [Streptomyces sp. ITFR-21]